MKLFNLEGKNAIITGGSSGLGIQFAKALANQGANLTIVARRYERLVEVSKEIENEYGVNCLPVKCDVMKEEEIKNAVQESYEEYGKIDILVNNAGVAAEAPANELKTDDWKWVMDVNLTGVFLFCQYVFDYMKEQDYGRIINIASMYGEVGNHAIPAAPYHASKGGVVNLTRALAGEWAKYDINVNSIGPGFFESEMTSEFINTEDFQAYLNSRCPMGRQGKEGELDGAIVFLASPSSSYVTGQTLCVDGGWTAV